MSPRRATRDSGGVLSRSTLVWVAIVVVVLVVVDVLLVALALSRTASADNGDAGPVPTFTSTASPSTSASATPGSTPTAGVAAAKSAERRLISAVNASEAWRALSGSCGGEASSLEHSTDSGATWTAVPLGDDVRSVLALEAGSSTVSILVGVGDDCETTVRTTTDGGSTWKAGSPGAAGAGIGNAGLVLSTGAVTSPCDSPVAAFQGQYTTLVACDNEVQWRSGSRTWVQVPIEGVRSIADDGDSYTLAQVDVSGCDGVQIASMPAVSVNPATRTTPVGCADSRADGTIALDRVSEAVWLWAGDRVAVSADGGVTW